MELVITSKNIIKSEMCPNNCLFTIKVSLKFNIVSIIINGIERAKSDHNVANKFFISKILAIYYSLDIL